MSRPRAVWRTLAAFAGAALLVAGASVFSQRSTSAEWTDQVGFTASATAADFADPPAPPTPAEAFIADLGGVLVMHPDADAVLDFEIYSAHAFCMSMAVTTTSATPIQWYVDVDTAMPPLNGRLPVLEGAVIASGPDANGIIRVAGSSNGSGTFHETANNASIVAGQSALVEACIPPGTAPGIPIPAPAGPQTYTYSTTLAASSPYYVCAQTTVVGHIEDFWIGFEATFDWREVLQDGLEAGLLNGGHLSPQEFYEGHVARTPVPEDSNWTQTPEPSEGPYAYTVHGTGLHHNAYLTAGSVFVVRSCSSF